MARGVDEVQLIGLTILCRGSSSVTLWALMVMPRSRSRSMESSTWASISRSDEATAQLYQAIGQGRLAVVDMGDDGKVPDVIALADTGNLTAVGQSLLSLMKHRLRGHSRDRARV